MPRRLVVGNWKMHGLTADLAELRAIDAARDIDVVVCPPFPLLTAAVASASHVAIGAQDCHPVESGAHTGAVSAAMIADAGAQWVILGHNEVRTAQRLDDAAVAARVAAAQQHLNVILCVGETARGDGGVAEQLLASIPATCDPIRLTVAYEPVWAIGSGVTPAMDEIATMHATLRQTLTKRCGPRGDAVRILYGGSVGPANAAAIAATPNVDGVLVGGASLRAATFAPIIEAMDMKGRDECVAA
ncbi:triose-phosphate isomerase [Sphingomonas sp.]|uniref:triose-phosphate isomerase n=1 Tax=Sphingomonas sp. TaxID=28214 RepID=UPI002DD67DC7|nr:triose-phosphate isomerase [Sphingomonas sp.]